MTETLSPTGDERGSSAPPSQVFRSELNPLDFLRRAAYVYPEKTAIVDGGRRSSYSALAERSWRLANALRAAGLGKGDRVATLLFNSAPMLEAHFGVPAAGGVLVAINNRLAAQEVGLPKTSTGKAQKFVLRESEWSGQRSRVGAT
jgi:fatty-acyl-CoA synthase